MLAKGPSHSAFDEPHCRGAARELTTLVMKIDWIRRESALICSIGSTSTVPSRAKVCPRFRGVWSRLARHPDFKTTDPRKIQRCVTERRCGICGKTMDREVVFVGGPLSMVSRIFNDPAMHEECARYAYEVCPFLAGRMEESPGIRTVAEARAHTSIRI
jgi:hypothetical protein